MTTQIFIQNATLLDCAILFPEQGPQGRSWYVDILWEGQKDENGFLFDFSLAKKSAKNTIDLEFDHKLLVRSSDIRFQSNTQIIVTCPQIVNEKESFFALNTYSKAIKKVSRETVLALADGDISLLEKVIANDIARNSPNNITKVTVSLREHVAKQENFYFNYTHSLCRHYGNCQRFHGHNGIVHVYLKGEFDLIKSEFAANALKNKYIVNTEYQNNAWASFLVQEILNHCSELNEAKDDLAAIQYTGNQGSIALLIPREKTLFLKQESTIENLADFLRSLFHETDKIEVKAFEGLCKGAISNE